MIVVPIKQFFLNVQRSMQNYDYKKLDGDKYEAADQEMQEVNSPVIINRKAQNKWTALNSTDDGFSVQENSNDVIDLEKQGDESRDLIDMGDSVQLSTHD